MQPHLFEGGAPDPRLRERRLTDALYTLMADRTPVREVEGGITVYQYAVNAEEDALLVEIIYDALMAQGRWEQARTEVPRLLTHRDFAIAKGRE